MNLEEWIDEKLRRVAERLPTSVHQDPASFTCGYNVGYKECLIDLRKELGLDDIEPQEIDDIL